MFFKLDNIYLRCVIFIIKVNLLSPVHFQICIEINKLNYFVINFNSTNNLPQSSISTFKYYSNFQLKWCPPIVRMGCNVEDHSF